MDNFFRLFRNSRIVRLKKGIKNDYRNGFFLIRGKALVTMTDDTDSINE